MHNFIHSIHNCSQTVLLYLIITSSNLYGDPLSQGGAWQGYRGEGLEWKDLIFRVERTLHSRLRTELEVFFGGENWEGQVPDFRVKGSPFHRSCIIYRGNSIAAQVMKFSSRYYHHHGCRCQGAGFGLDLCKPLPGPFTFGPKLCPVLSCSLESMV